MAFDLHARRVAIHGMLDDREAWRLELEAMASIAASLGDAALHARTLAARAELLSARFLRVTLATYMAHPEIFLSDPVAAARSIERELATGESKGLDVEYMMSVLALARLHGGDPEGALAALGDRAFRE